MVFTPVNFIFTVLQSAFTVVNSILQVVEGGFYGSKLYFYTLFAYLCDDKISINIKKQYADGINKEKNAQGNTVVQGAKFPIQKLNNKIINHGKAFRSYLKI